MILVNSNPATIMTDPEFADATYVEPITPEMVEKIIAKERPDALLPTLGGQTALNTAVALHEAGVLDKYGVELIGANIDAIQAGEDRDSFKRVVERVGGESARSVICHSIEECLAAAEELNYPVVVRPSFTLGGAGSGFAHNEEELRRIAGQGLALSPTTEVLLEESILGWKEYELELMRDANDNVIVVCSIENLDPMGVHTGDSITVAPAMTLTDREYQRLRDLGIAIIREVGVDTGGCNIQFAVHPETGRTIVIEMNPRVSRSSALASKATGFPIAKIAAKLAVGYTLDEITNDITAKTLASFEPTLDYVVVKVPRFAFEKFPGADPGLTTTMKSVGEVMAIGRSFPEALQKAMRSLEKKGSSFTWTGDPGDKEELLRAVRTPSEHRLRQVQQALRAGATVAELHEATKIDRGSSTRSSGWTRRPANSPPLPASTRTCCAPPNSSASPTRRSARSPAAPKKSCGSCATPSTCTRSTWPWTPAPPSSPRPRPTCTPATTRRPRSRPAASPRSSSSLRTQPDRPGRGVRLQLRPRVLRPVGGRLRDRHGQLQP